MKNIVSRLNPAIIALLALASLSAGCDYSKSKPSSAIPAPVEDGGDDATGGLGGAKFITGKITGVDGLPVPEGATVYVTQRSLSAALTTQAAGTAIQADCGSHGGTLFCAAPMETYCGASCTCNDGTYSIDVSACPDTANRVLYQYGEQLARSTPSCGADSNCNIDFAALAPVNAPLRAVDTLCNKIIACNPGVDFEECRSGILAYDQLADNLGFGVNDGDHTPWQRIVDNPPLPIDPAAFEDCLDEIGSLACETTGEIYGVNIGFDPDNHGADRWDNVENIAGDPNLEPSRCESAFSETLDSSSF